MTVILQVDFTPLPSLVEQVITAVPFPVAVTVPAGETVATLVLLLFHETVLLLAEAGPTPALRSSVLPFKSVAEDLPRLMTLTGILTVTLQEADAPLPSLAVRGLRPELHGLAVQERCGTP